MTELGETFEAYKDSNDERLVEITKKGSEDPILIERLGKIDEAVQEASDKVEGLGSDFETRLDQMDAALNRVTSGDIEDTEKDKENSDFINRCCLAHRTEPNCTVARMAESVKPFHSLHHVS